jgi:hypothetical protein
LLLGRLTGIHIHLGVAYSSAPEWLPPKTIQRWPGKLPGELSNKVPTCIEYDEESGTVRNWGFLCDPEDKGSNVKEFFKLHLAPQYHDDNPGCPTRHESQCWFRDYIHCIYRHVISHFATTIPQFGSRQVEFLFSVPTTWKDVRMVEETRKILEQVICAKTPMHRVSIGLTEAEAAAVYAGNEHYQVSFAHTAEGLLLFSGSPFSWNRKEILCWYATLVEERL